MDEKSSMNENFEKNNQSAAPLLRRKSNTAIRSETNQWAICTKRLPPENTVRALYTPLPEPTLNHRTTRLCVSERGVFYRKPRSKETTHAPPHAGRRCCQPDFHAPHAPSPKMTRAARADGLCSPRRRESRYGLGFSRR
ncbi:hypothetical protein Adt_13723 [Abeliophyllum distichum]|uniref:Uncharacterized protein n=1 Tax=Abeliophyllum distichum TaxID=126358 RepID=A0ABD1TXN5_9LAMI